MVFKHLKPLAKCKHIVRPNFLKSFELPNTPSFFYTLKWNMRSSMFSKQLKNADYTYYRYKEVKEGQIFDDHASLEAKNGLILIKMHVNLLVPIFEETSI